MASPPQAVEPAPVPGNPALRWWLELGFPLAAAFFWWPAENPYGLPKVTALSLWVLVIWRLKPDRFQPRCNLYPLLLWSMWGFVLAGWLYALDPMRFWEAVPTLLLVGLGLATGWTDHDQKACLRGLAWLALANGLYGLLQRSGWNIPPLDTAGQASAFLGNPNHSAQLMVLALCITPSWTPIRLWLYRALLLVAILACASKAAIAVALVVLTRHLGVRVLTLIPPAALLLAALLFLPGGARADRLFTYLKNPGIYMQHYALQPELIKDRSPWFKGKHLSLMTRYFLWINASQFLPERPLLGTGLNQFRTHYPRYATRGLGDINLNHLYRPESSHNLLLDSTLMLGWIWTACLAVYLLALYRNGTASFRLMLMATLALSLVTTAHKEPLILLLLLIWRPIHAPKPSRHGPKGALLVAGLTLPILGLALFWDNQSNRQPINTAFLPRFFHESRMRGYFTESQYKRAYLEAVAAWHQDPYGPNTLHDLAVTASAVDKPWISAVALCLQQRIAFRYSPSEEMWPSLRPLAPPHWQSMTVENLIWELERLIQIPAKPQ